MKAGLLGSLVGVGTLSAFTVSIGAATAGNFNNVQQTYAPPSAISRRYDIDSAGQTNWGTDINGNPIGTPKSQPNQVYAGSAVVNKASNNGAVGLAYGNDSKTLAKLMKQGKWDDAEKVARRLEKVNSIDPTLKANLVKILVTKANIFYNTGDYDNAGKKAREAMAYDFANTSARTVLGQVFSKQGLNSKLAKDHLQVGDSLAAQSRFVEGSVEYRLALSIAPSAAGHIGLGNIAVSHNRIDDAKIEYTKALQVDPKSSVAYRQLGSLKYATRDLVGANQDLSKAVSLNSQDELAKAALIELWRRQVLQNPKDVNGHLGLARAFLQTGDLDSARSEYQQVAAIDPQNPHLPAARAAFKIALAKRQSHNCYQAAMTLHGQGAHNDAHQKLLEALSYSPGSPDVLLLNGQVCEKLGLVDEAHDAYMSVLKEDPQNVLAAQRLKSLPGSAGTNAAVPSAAPARGVSQDGTPQPAPNINSNGSPATGALPANSQSSLSGSAPNSVSGASGDPIGDAASSLKAEAPIVDPTPTQSMQAMPPVQTLGQAPSLPADYPASLLPGASQSPSLAGEAEADQQLASTSAHTSTISSLMNSVRNFSNAHQQAIQNVESGAQNALQNSGILGGNSSSNNASPYPMYYGYGYGYPYGAYPPGSYPAYNLQGGSIPVASFNSNVLNNSMQGGIGMTTKVSNSSSPSSSLLQFLGTPLASKMGFQPIATTNSNQPPQIATMTVNQMIVGSNGAAYMVPMAVPVNLPMNSNGTSSGALSGGFAQKLHLGSVVNANQALSNLLSGNSASQAQPQNPQYLPVMMGPNGTLVAMQPTGQTNAVPAAPASPQASPVAQSSTATQPANAAPSDASAPSTNASQPLISVADWNTGGSSAPDSAAASSATPGASDGANWTVATGSNSVVALKPPVASAQSASDNPTVALQITEVKPTMGGVKVKVVVKNTGSTDVRIPDGQKIALNTTANGLHMLDVNFQSSIIPAGGQIVGVAKMPTKKLDASTDVFLPSFYNDGTKLTDLHVTPAM